ncbi:MAG: hypothetical protein ACUVS7_16930, partial [Bryobacteraceae bacterium]
ERRANETEPPPPGAALENYHPGAPNKPDPHMALRASTPGTQFTPAGVLRVPLPQCDPAGLLGYLRRLLEHLRG